MFTSSFLICSCKLVSCLILWLISILYLINKKMKVLGKRKVGWPRKTWKDKVKKDLKLIGVDENVKLDRRRWRKIIASLTPTKGKTWISNENDEEEYIPNIFIICAALNVAIIVTPTLFCILCSYILIKSGLQQIMTPLSFSRTTVIQ